MRDAQVRRVPVVNDMGRLVRRGSEDESPGGTYHVSMTSFRMSVTVLAVMHALFAGFTALVGAFANGWDIWQRLLVVLLHPLGAAGVLVLVLRPRLATTTILALAALLTVNVVADLGPCAADGRGPRAGRLGAGAGLLSGSGNRSGLRAGAAAHGPQNGRVRRRRKLETRWSRGPKPCSMVHQVAGPLLRRVSGAANRRFRAPRSGRPSTRS